MDNRGRLWTFSFNLYPLPFNLFPSTFNLPFLKLFAQAGRPVVGLAVVGVASCLNVVAESRQRFSQRAGEIGVRTHELGWRLKAQAHQIVQHQDLPVAFGPRADADGWDAQAFGDDGGEPPRNALE